MACASFFDYGPPVGHPAGTSSAKPGRNFVQGRAGPVFRRMDRLADVNKSRKAFAFTHAEGIKDTPVVGVPFGDPVGRIANGVGSKDKTHRGCARREYLLPFGNFHMRRGPAHHGDDQRCAREPLLFELDLFRLGIRISGPEGGLYGCPRLQTRIALEYDEAPGRELAVVRYA